MKSYKLVGREKFQLFDVPTPALRTSHDVLLQIRKVGICGSDVHYYSDGRIGSQVVEYPWSVGHESSATVIEVGNDVRSLKPGDNVAIDPAIPCLECEQCLAGRPHTCLHHIFLGCPGQIEGCLSEYFVLPARCCIQLPDNVSLEQGALVEPLSIGVYGVSLSKVKARTVGILGSGPIGLCVLAACNAAGASAVYVTDKIEDRLFFARENGATRAFNFLSSGIEEEIRQEVNGGLDIVFECCGQQDALSQALRLLKPGGELSIIGIPETDSVSFDINLLRRKELSIQNVRRQNACAVKALDMIAGGALNTKGFITHSFDFRSTPEAFELVKNYRDGVIKAMISFD